MTTRNSQLIDALESIGIQYRGHDRIRCKCPIHMGKDLNCSVSLKTGTWCCWSYHCEAEVGNKLSNLFDYLKIKYVGHQYRSDNPHKKETFNHKVIERDKFESHSHVVPYFLNRGITQETLNKYLAVYCGKRTHKFFNRAILPDFNDTDDIIGYTGRSIRNQQPKWLHSNFSKSHVLYNLNFAKKFIQETGDVIITEGPLDVLKLEDGRVHNSIALLGTDISDYQISLLSKYGAKNILLMLDPDLAGMKTTLGKMQDRLSTKFNVFSGRHLLTKDIGDMSLFYIRTNLKYKIGEMFDAFAE